MSEIVVTALDRSRTFAGQEELAEHVAEFLPHGHYDPMEGACIKKLAELNGAATPRVREIARSLTLYEPERPKNETPFKDRIAETRQENEDKEEARLATNDVWRVGQRRTRAEGTQRMRKAAGNPTKIARAQSWIAEREAELAGLEFEARAADDAARRARARLNALLAAESRWRQDQDTTVMYDGAAVSLAEFSELRKAEGK